MICSLCNTKISMTKSGRIFYSTEEGERAVKPLSGNITCNDGVCFCKECIDFMGKYLSPRHKSEIANLNKVITHQLDYIDLMHKEFDKVNKEVNIKKYLKRLDEAKKDHDIKQR